MSIPDQLNALISQFETLFEQGDANNDGEIDWTEWQDVTEQIFPHMSSEESRTIFYQMATEDGVIVYAEFCKNLREHARKNPNTQPMEFLSSFFATFFSDGPNDAAEESLQSSLERTHHRRDTLLKANHDVISQLQEWIDDTGRPAVLRVEELENEMADLRRHFEDEKMQLESRIDRLKHLNDQLGSENDALSQANRDLQAIVNEHNALRENIFNQKSEVDDLSSNLSRVVEELEVEHKANMRLQKQLSDLQQEKESLLERDVKSFRDLEGLRTDLQIAESHRQHAEDRFYDLTEKYKKYRQDKDEEVWRLNQLNKELQHELQQARLEMTLMETTLSGTRSTSNSVWETLDRDRSATMRVPLPSQDFQLPRQQTLTATTNKKPLHDRQETVGFSLMSQLGGADDASVGGSDVEEYDMMDILESIQQQDLQPESEPPTREMSPVSGPSKGKEIWMRAKDKAVKEARLKKIMGRSHRVLESYAGSGPLTKTKKQKKSSVKSIGGLSSVTENREEIQEMIEKLQDLFTERFDGLKTNLDGESGELRSKLEGLAVAVSEKTSEQSQMIVNLLQEKISVLESSLNEVKAENVRLREQLDAVNNTSPGQEMDDRQLEGIARIIDMTAVLTGEMSDMKSVLQSVQKERDQLLDQLQQQTEGRVTAGQLSDDHAMRLLQSTSQLQQDISQMREQLAFVQEERIQYQSKCEAAEIELSKANKEVKRLADELEDAKQSKFDAISRAAEEMDNLRQECADMGQLQTQLQDLRRVRAEELEQRKDRGLLAGIFNL